jgi:hypothetical protein
MRRTGEPVGWRSFEWAVTGIANDLRCPASRLWFADVVLSANHFDNS